MLDISTYVFFVGPKSEGELESLVEADPCGLSKHSPTNTKELDELYALLFRCIMNSSFLHRF